MSLPRGLCCVGAADEHVADHDYSRGVRSVRAGRQQVPVLLLLLVLPALAQGTQRYGVRHYSDEEYYQLPRLFHLDEYSRCEARGGLYCLATFHLSAPPPPASNHTYSLIQEYSSWERNFNRRLLHRGWCVSERCGDGGDGDGGGDAVERLQRCAAEWGRRHSLTAHIHKLHYCHTPDTPRTHAHIDTPSLVFLYVVCVILLLNLIGTLYDIYSTDKKNALVMSWSMRCNWRRLTTTRDHSTDPRQPHLAPIKGFKMMLMLLTMAAHAAVLQTSHYLYEPRVAEQRYESRWLQIALNGAVPVHGFTLLANFLLAHNLLSYKGVVRMRDLPKLIIYRLLRTWPLHVVVVGFAATWWARAGEGAGGPLWHLSVQRESDICRRKFWTHALYVNNLVDNDQNCFLPLWFLGVDMQLYVISVVVCVWLASRRRAAPRVLALLMLASVILNGCLAYVFNWQPTLHYNTVESIGRLHEGVPSFQWLHTAPWGSLPAALAGLLLAFAQHHLNSQGDFRIHNHKWLVWSHRAVLALVCMWCASGLEAREVRTRGFLAAYIALERLVINALLAFWLFGFMNRIDSWWSGVLSWRGWGVLERLNLAVLLAHWPLNLSLLALSPQPTSAALPHLMMEIAGTVCGAYLVAVPLTLLVEMPAQRSLTALLV